MSPLTKAAFFIRENWRLLGFGFACTLASNFGQTFFIALFGENLRADFALSHVQFGALYSIATLASAIIILGTGRLIDRVDLRLFTAAVFIGLALSSAAMSMVGTTLGLGAALMGLRLFGQGLLRHTAVISQARYFDTARGRAMSFVGLGYPLAEATFPAVLVFLLATLNWREVWGWMGAYIALFHLPLVLWLLKGHGIRHQKLEAKIASEKKAPHPLSDLAIAQDWRFQLIVPASLMSPFIMTGLFFHQLAIAADKGWDITLLAASFPAFAAATVISSLCTGMQVDRHGPGWVLTIFVWPLVMALLVVAYSNHPFSAPLYLALGGLTTGASTVLISAAWAETFGVQHLGKIRSLTSALAVLSTALAPVWAGWLLDTGWSIRSIAIAAAMLTAITGFLILFPARAMRQARDSKIH